MEARWTRKLRRGFCLLVLGLGASCFTLTHSVGGGPAGDETVSARQWYVLWGLFRLNEVDSDDLAGNATSYRITTQWGPTDIVLNLLTGWVSVVSRTVTVER